MIFRFASIGPVAGAPNLGYLEVLIFENLRNSAILSKDKLFQLFFSVTLTTGNLNFESWKSFLILMTKVPNYPISVIDFHGTEDDTIPYDLNSPECVGEGPQGNSISIKKNGWKIVGLFHGGLFRYHNCLWWVLLLPKGNRHCQVKYHSYFTCCINMVYWSP